MKRVLQVVEPYDPAKDYGLKIHKRYERILRSLKKGDQITPTEFIKTRMDSFTKSVGYHNQQVLANSAFRIGRKIGVLQDIVKDTAPNRHDDRV